VTERGEVIVIIQGVSFGEGDEYETDFTRQDLKQQGISELRIITDKKDIAKIRATQI